MKIFPFRLVRVHDSGTQALLSQAPHGWRINIHLREVHHKPVTIVGYLQPTVQLAKQRADDEISKLGHVCSASCQGWKGC